MEGKKRRIKLHRGLTFVLAIALTVAIAVVVFQRSGLLSYQLTQYINDHYFKDTPFKFSCGKVTTDIVSAAVIADPTIRYEDDDRSVKVFSAEAIRIQYDVIEALKLNVVVEYLELAKVRISLWHDREGRPIVPVPRSAGGLPVEGTSPRVEVRQFAVQDLQFVVEKDDAPFSIRDVALRGSARYVDGEGKVEIDQGRAYLAEKDRDVSSIRATVEFGSGGVRVTDLVVRLEQSLIMLSGGYQNGQFRHFQGVFNPLNLDELSELGWIPEEHGEVGGSIVASGTRDSLAVQGSLTGHALGLVFSGLSLKGVVTPQRIRLSQIEGQVHGCRLNGNVEYQRDTGSYTFQGACEDLDITEGFLPEGGAPQTDLNGVIRLRYDGVGKTYDVAAELRNSVVSGFEAEEIQFTGRWSENAGLDVRKFRVARSGFALGGSGRIDNRDRVDVVLNIKGDELGYPLDYLTLPRIGGTADLTAKLEGPVTELQVNVNGSWRDLTYLSARIDSGQVHAEARRVGSPRAAATVDVEGRRLYLGERVFSSPHVLFDVEGGTLAVRDFSFSKGDTLVTADFEVETGNAVTPLIIKHLAVRTPDMTWQNRGRTKVTLSEASTVIDALVLTTNGYEVGTSGRYAPSTDATDLRVWGNNVDLSLIPWGADSPFRIAGSGTFDVAIRGDLDHPDIRLLLDVRRGFLDEFAFTRLSVDAGFSNGRYRLDRLRLEQGRDSLVVRGWWDYPPSPIAVARTGLNREEAWDAGVYAELRSDHFSMTPVLKRALKDPRWGGAFSGSVTLTGTLAEPRMDLVGVVAASADSGMVLPDIHADVGYEGRRLIVRSLAMDDGRNRLNAKGTLPVVFDVTKGFIFDRRAPIDFSADVSVGDLSLIAGYVGPVAAATGRLGGRVDLRGAAEEFEYGGEFRLSDAAFRLAGSDEIFRDVSADIAVRNRRVTLSSLNARKGKQGLITAQGSAVLRGVDVSEYVLDVTLNDVPFSMIPGFHSTQNGEVRVTSRKDETGRLVPFLAGTLDVKEAVVTRSLAAQEGPPSPLTMPTESPSWLCDLEIQAPKNVWVRNPEVNMEMGGDLILKRDQTGLYLRGDLSVLRGSYSLYNNKFRITEGRFDFATATTLRPGISLDAYTPYRRAGEVEHRIFLNLSWPADEKEPKITLSYSEPGYSEADVWAMLGGQVVTGGAAFTEGEAWNAGETATSLASNYLERILNAQMSDMTIAVESSPVGETGGSGTAESELSIAVGRYLSEDFYLNYRQGLRVTGARQVDVEYRLSNVFLLRTEIIQYSQKGLQGKSRQTTDEINFDIKFRWEY